MMLTADYLIFITSQALTCVLTPKSTNRWKQHDALELWAYLRPVSDSSFR
jgi:hypothetical protein